MYSEICEGGYSGLGGGEGKVTVRWVYCKMGIDCPRIRRILEKDGGDTYTRIQNS